MRGRALFVALIASFVPPALGAAEVAWDLDAAHSHISFSVRHLGISNVRGEFKKFEASITANAEEAKVSALEALVQVASIDTGIAKRDDHLRSADFFDVSKYPTMRLKLRSIVWKGDDFVAKADLTIKDVTKTIEFMGELLGVRTSAYLSARSPRGRRS